VVNQGQYTFMGRDLTPVIRDAADHPANPTATVQDSIYFTTDEVIGAEIVRQPAHIRCLREARWKVAEYFDPSGEKHSAYELYDLLNDPLEEHNMGNPENHGYYDQAKLSEMLVKLHRKMEEVDTHPLSVAQRERKETSLRRSPAPVGSP